MPLFGGGFSGILNLIDVHCLWHNCFAIILGIVEKHLPFIVQLDRESFVYTKGLPIIDFGKSKSNQFRLEN